jgi:hypothetical protein
VPGLLLHHLLDVPHGGVFVPAPSSSPLCLRVGVTRVTLRTAVSWNLLVMVAVRRGTLAVTTRWLVVLLPFWDSLGIFLPCCLGTGSVFGYSWVGLSWQQAPGASCSGKPSTPPSTPCLWALSHYSLSEGCVLQQRGRAHPVPLVPCHGVAQGEGCVLWWWEESAR